MFNSYEIAEVEALIEGSIQAISRTGYSQK
jgi:hypothetical protein